MCFLQGSLGSDLWDAPQQSRSLPKGGMALLKAPIYTVIRDCANPCEPVTFSSLPPAPPHTESGQAQRVFNKHHKLPGAVLDPEDMMVSCVRTTPGSWRAHNLVRKTHVK